MKAADMTRAELVPCPTCGEALDDPELHLQRFSADAQALADVRTLDEWAGRGDPDRYWGMSPTAECVVYDRSVGSRERIFIGDTPDAARAKAAAWVREQKP